MRNATRRRMQRGSTRKEPKGRVVVFEMSRRLSQDKRGRRAADLSDSRFDGERQKTAPPSRQALPLQPLWLFIVTGHSVSPSPSFVCHRADIPTIGLSLTAEPFPSSVGNDPRFSNGRTPKYTDNSCSLHSEHLNDNNTNNTNVCSCRWK